MSLGQLGDPLILAVLDFQFLCSRPETPGCYSIYLFTKNEGHGRKQGRS